MKSLIKSGTNEWGAWRIVEFIIERTYMKKKLQILFVARGKWATFIETVPIKERISVEYIPELKQYGTKRFQDLKATNIEKYVKRKTAAVYFGGELVNKSDFEINPDLSLPLKQE